MCVGRESYACSHLRPHLVALQDLGIQWDVDPAKDPGSIPRAMSAMAKVRVKNEAEPAPKRTKVKPSPGSLLNIRIRHWSGEVTFFGVKKTTRLNKVFDAYAQRRGVNVMTLRFLFDGQRVLSDATPQDLDMEDGDQLDCTLEPRMR